MKLDNLTIEIIISLFSGIFGAIIGALVGGYISYKGAMDSTKTQIKHLYKQEVDKREYKNKQEEKTAINSLLSEVKENLDLSIKWQTSSSKSILSTETWSIYKGVIPSLPESMQEKIIKSYAEIKRYNALAEYDRARVDFGSGALDQALQKQASVVVDALTPVVEELNNHLLVIPPEKTKGGEL